MEMTRSSRGDSLSQRLELGCYEPSAHFRREGYKFWRGEMWTVIMDVGEVSELACVLILIWISGPVVLVMLSTPTI
jgi:hypothetical protein